MIFKTKPKNFKPSFIAVGAFVQCDGEIILLHRQNHKPQGETWGIPSGKVHSGENPLSTACRETEEETGVVIPESQMNFFSTVYVRYAVYDFVYHIYHANLENRADIKIKQDEHRDAKWISPQNALGLPLIEDLDACIELFFGIKTLKG